MGLFDLLPGRPSPEHFARRITAVLRRAGISEPIQYNPADFALRMGEQDQPRTLFLRNLYEAYLASPRMQRRRLIEAHVQQLLNMPEMPERFEAARLHLRVQVRDRLFHELLGLQQKLAGHHGEIAPIPYRPLATHLACGLSLDTPEAIMSVSADSLEQWGVGFEAALKVGEENLWAISNEKWQNPQPGLYVSPWQDCWDASRLFLHGLIWQLAVQGAHVAAIPNRDVLIVTGDQDQAGLAELARLVESTYVQGPRPLCARPFVLQDGQWRPFMPAPDDPLRSTFERLRILDEVAMYGEQGAVLQRLNEQQGVDVYVANYATGQRPAASFSCCTWSEGVPSLLPRTDRVALFAGDPAGDGQTLGMADWKQVEAAAGDLMRPMGLYPERFEVRQFPSPQQLAAMGLEKL